MSNSEWQSLSKPVPLPNNVKSTVNNKGQKNYLFEMNNNPMWIPATLVRNGMMTARPKRCSECSLKSSSVSSESDLEKAAPYILLAAIVGLVGLAAIVHK